MGCPIRKFPDQSLFAAPRNLSQRTTSFIASQRQGIRRIPFWHLIMLEIRKRNRQRTFYTLAQRLLIRKDQFCFKRIREPRGQAKGSRLVAKTRKTDHAGEIKVTLARRRAFSGKPDALPLHNVNVSRNQPRA